MKKAFSLVIVLLVGVMLCACQPKTTQLTAYLSNDLSEAEHRALTAVISQMEDVETAQYITAEEALEDFLGHYEDTTAFAGVEASDLRARIEITVKSSDTDSVTAQLLQLDGVEKVSRLEDVSSTVTFGLWLQRLLGY